MSAQRIYARWTYQMSLSLPDHLQPVPAHAYDVPIPIETCPRRGERIRVIALSPMAYRTLHVPIGATYYDVYDPYVEGMVEGVQLLDQKRVAFAVKNDRSEAGVQWVVLTAPFVPETMVPPTAEDCPLEWLRRCLAGGRSTVVMQRDAVVVDKLGGDSSPPVTLQYPDPCVQRRDRMLTDRCDRWRPSKHMAAVPEPM